MFVFVRWILLAAAFLTQTLFECSSAATLQACRQQILEFEAQESSTAIKSQAAALRAARKVCKVAVKNADASALREPAKHWEAMQSHALLGDVFYYGRAFELAITEYQRAHTLKMSVKEDAEFQEFRLRLKESLDAAVGRKNTEIQTVSIIVPCHNNADTLTRALESISEAAEHFFQSSANRTQRVLYLKLPPAIRVEVIVVDDNSSDNSEPPSQRPRSRRCPCPAAFHGFVQNRQANGLAAEEASVPELLTWNLVRRERSGEGWGAGGARNYGVAESTGQVSEARTRI
ncbi:hypothetical protein CYMTET_27408 [Cymbomonas tetramitiformis]|uniref:Glycosyltransferase 2-like domain-containing protein n=1 Tax=Cymbomonas tetramitiformis TaxID=36881 RepID=A0AAE0KX85_9CHLO|nr:hypothetical protein CYMTET_27408 [Cymbomonas tetramitiformis]